MLLRKKRNKHYSQVLIDEVSEFLEVIPDATVHYQWRRKKNVSLRVYPGRRVVVRAPTHLTLPGLRAFVTAHLKWIMKRLDRLEGDKSRTSFFKESPCLLGSICSFDPLDDKEETNIKAWYRRQALLYLPARCKELSRSFPLPTGTSPIVSVRWMKRRWGSCRRDGLVTLNAALVICPPPLIDYVIIHELAHLVVPAHNSEFYRLLEIWLPNHRALKKELNDKWSQVLDVLPSGQV